MNNDFDFIKEKFDNDNLSAPSTISEKEIMSKLSDRPKLRLIDRRGFKAFISAVACLALVVGAVSFSQAGSGTPPVADSEQINSPVPSFTSYSEIKKRVNDRPFSLYSSIFDSTAKDIALEETTDMDMASTASYASDFTTSYGETYTQVKGVDEADIIKNDGRYIYYVNENNQIMIYEGKELVCNIDDLVDRNGRGAIEDVLYDSYEYVHEIYVRGSTLVVNTTYNNYSDNLSRSVAKSYIYDLSDISSPKLVEEFEQSGGYTSSRMIGSMLYVISTEFIYQCKTVNDCYITTSKGGKDTVLPASSIYYCEESNEQNYIIVSAIDTEDLSKSSDTKAFYGCSTDIYCSTKNLYLMLSGADKTTIVRAELDEGGISFTAKGEVDGYIHNQFSVDESGDYFRIATTDADANNLYVLDKELNAVGSVTGFAKGERIEAVRYIGDMAYVITYVVTDPLFVIDLSEPTSPVIKGEVEITGFSSQLVPVDEGTLLGIGYDDEFGVKLALFDISDSASPKVLDSAVIKNSSSNAQLSHKAIVVNRAKGYFAFDFDKYERGNIESGAIVLEIRDGKIVITDRLTINCNDESYATRVTFIDNILFVFDNCGEIYSFNR